MKHHKIGGWVSTGFQVHFRILKRAPKNISPGNVGDDDGEGERGKKNFPVIPSRNCTASKSPNRKGTFDVNLVLYNDISLYKKGTFHHKKGTFSPLKKFGEGGMCLLCPPPGSYAPGHRRKLNRTRALKCALINCQHIIGYWKYIPNSYGKI